MRYADVTIPEQEWFKIQGHTYYRQLGTVESTFMGIELDHNMFVFRISFKFGATGQGVHRGCSGEEGLATFKDMFTVIGPWEQLVGKQFYVVRKEEVRGSGPDIIGIQSVQDPDSIVFFEPQPDLIVKNPHTQSAKKNIKISTDLADPCDVTPEQLRQAVDEGRQWRDAIDKASVQMVRPSLAEFFKDKLK